MRRIDVDELKKIELSLLIEVDKICRENGFRYMLGYGTLLGAVRHGGFIPWDDDIDIIMPRPDYDKFIDYCDKNDVDFNLFSSANNREYTQMFLKVCNKDTVVDTGTDFKMCRFGVWVDIFPIDGLGDTVPKAKRFVILISCAKLLCAVAQWKTYKRNKKNGPIYELIRFFTFLISRLIFDVNAFVQKMDKKARTHEFGESKYCGCLCDFCDYESVVMPREMFEKICELTFENHSFFCPANYDAYLRQIYGNYMELPPVEEQQTHHLFEAYWKE